MRVRILPYKLGSGSARLLSTALAALRVRPDGRYRPRRGDFIINWGSGRLPNWWSDDRNYKVLNHPRDVENAANKLRTFQILRAAGISIVDFTTDRNVVYEWYDANDNVYARTSLTGHSGRGIVVLEPGEAVPEAPLYTRGVVNEGEYRVHVVNGQVIDYIKKRRRNGEQPTLEESEIRNLANGWIYTRENLRRLERIEQLAVQAVAALGLDFGAVDIIKDEVGDVFVLEVNTACGMSDTTLEAYSEAFSNLIEDYARTTAV